MVKSLSGFSFSIPMYRHWPLQYSMDANDLNNFPVKEKKMMLLAILKMFFFHTGINDSSKVTLKLGEKVPRVAGGGEGMELFNSGLQ